MAKKPFIVKNGLSVNDTTIIGDNGKLHANNTITDGTIVVSMLQETPVSNTTFQSTLANTNAYIGSVDSTRASDLANTNAYIGSVDSSRASDLANTNAYIASVDSTRASDLANTNAYIAAVQLDVDNNESTERAALANTNAKLLNIETNLLGTNTAIRSLVTGSYVTNTTFQSTLANTNVYIASVSSTERSALANTNAYIASVQSDVNSNEATELLHLANTNAYISSVSATERSALANTNSKLLNIESNLLSTNTDVRLYIDNEIAALVNSAPTTLDTLNELAAALGDNPNFATTLTTNLGQKLGSTASITLTGAVTGSGSFSSNAVSITTTATSDPTITLGGDLTGSVTLTNLGSGTLTATVVDDSHTHDTRYYTETEMDAFLVGQQTTTYISGDINSVSDGWYSWASTNPTNSPFDYAIMLQASDPNQKIQLAFGGVNPGNIAIRRADSGTFYAWAYAWTDKNDGSGSGLDADLLDGQQGTYYQPASTALTTSTTFGGDVSGTYNAIVVADDSHNHIISNVDGLQTALDAKISNNTDTTWTATSSNSFKFQSTDTIDSASGNLAALEVYQDTVGADAFMAFHVAGDYAAYFGLHGGIDDFVVGGWSKGATYQRVFHDGYHPNADTLTTARTIALGGDVTGSASFNGSANITITAAVADDSHAHSFNNLLNKTSGTGTYTTSGDFRAPIFYDSDNTAYYTDPANTGTSGNFAGTLVAATFNATSVTNGGFQGIDADSATNPSFTWTADLDTGMYRATTNSIGFTAGGAVSATITTSGIQTSKGFYNNVLPESAPIRTLTLAAGGSGWNDGTYNNVLINGGTYGLMQVVVSGGTVTSVTLTNPGYGYLSASGVNCDSRLDDQAGLGSGFTVNITVQAALIHLYANPGIIRITQADSSSGANQEIGSIRFAVRDASTNGSGDTAQIIGLSRSTSGGGYLLFKTTNNGGGATQKDTMRLLDGDGLFYQNLAVNGNFNAPIFYDSDNTAFYVNPNSTSNFGGSITVNGLDQSIIADRDLSSATDGWCARIISKNDTANVSSFLGNYRGYAGVFAHNAALTAWAPIYINHLMGSSTANVYLGNTYSPIYYDDNNTAYYTDPASTSILNALTLTSLTGAVVSSSNFTSSVGLVIYDSAGSAVKTLYGAGS